MIELYKSLLLCVLYGTVLSAGYDVFSNPTEDFVPEICRPKTLGGIKWILHVREPDYGWKENTHRANIALAVNRWEGTKEEMAKMELQLEEEIINSLLRNDISGIDETDLALFIHALIATKKNPRDFHGTDLVADLLHRVNAQENVNPFLVLALCNSNAVEFDHLRKITTYTKHRDLDGPLGSWEAQMKALALKALACAASLPEAEKRGLNKFRNSMEEAEKCLISKESDDGKYGNPFTTSLVVQALTAFGNKKWKEEQALEFLRQKSEVGVNLVLSYYLEMALNARKVKFIKDLYGVPVVAEPKTEPAYYTTYTVKDDQNPDTYFSVIMKIPRGWNFFNVMEKASNLSNRFEFDYVVDKNKEPMVFTVVRKPNDAEQNMFWRICRQSSVAAGSSLIKTFRESPAHLIPEDDEHIILWYRSSDCPLK